MNHVMSQEQKREKEIEVSDLQWLMDQPKGRRFMWRLLGLCELYVATFSPDALYTAFRDGKRILGTTLMGEIHATCFNQYLLMMEENKDNG